MSFIICEELVKIYAVAELEVFALQGLDLSVARGEMVAVIGASGSGKTTLLNVVGGLDRPSAGKLLVDGESLLHFSERALDRYRRRTVGFVWQQTGRNLLPYLTAQQNVMLPALLAGRGWRAAQEWAVELLHAVGLWQWRGQRPVQLSGGQQQRVSIAVALANRPPLLLADEPTGELDSEATQEVLTLLRDINARYGTTMVLVTHDAQVADIVDRTVTLRDGRTSSEMVARVPEGAAPEAFMEEYTVVDDAGRLQLPTHLLQTAGIGRRVSLELVQDGVLIRPANAGSGDDGRVDATPESADGVHDEAQPERRPFWRRLRSG
ncbi:MAG: ABC transporter ATP-binding protein [bacterium]